MRSVLLALLLTCSAAWAQGLGAVPAASEGTPATSAGFGEGAHLELGLSAQYAYGLGRVSQGALMGDLTFGTAPLVLDAAWVFNPHLALGAYVGWGPMFANNCPSAVSCSGSSLRFGLRARYQFSSGSLSPWVALGSGFERLTETDSYQAMSLSSSLVGLELVRLELGVQHPVSSSLAIGPFVSGSVGRYLSSELEGRSNDLNQAFHYWVAAGLRGAFTL